MLESGFYDLADGYVPDQDKDGNYIYSGRLELDRVEIGVIICAMGGAPGEMRCFTEEKRVLVSKDGSVWIEPDNLDINHDH